jgi:hypothetical protein
MHHKYFSMDRDVIDLDPAFPVCQVEVRTNPLDEHTMAELFEDIGQWTNGLT